MPTSVAQPDVPDALGTLRSPFERPRVMQTRNLKVAASLDAHADPSARRASSSADVAEVATEVVGKRMSDADTAALNARVGELLVEAGVLAPEQVQTVLARQATHPRRFGELVVGLGLAAQSDIDLALSRQLEIDFVPGTPGAEPTSALSVDELQSRQLEVMRSVRSQLLLRWFGEMPEQRTLAVMSLQTGDGRSHICALLGRLFAQSQEDTLLIDTHFGRPALHERFGLDNRSGLVSYLSRQQKRVPIRAVAGCPNLHVLTTGPASVDDLALLERSMFARLLSTLARRYSAILIDTPAANLRSEAVTVAVRSSGCLIVTRRNRTRMMDVQKLSQRLAQHGVEVLGAVVNEY
jgi:protein-tyrosine kinase